MRSDDIGKLLRTIYVSPSFQIFAHSNAIATCQDNSPQMFVLPFQIDILTFSFHSLFLCLDGSLPIIYLELSHK